METDHDDLTTEQLDQLLDVRAQVLAQISIVTAGGSLDPAIGGTIASLLWLCELEGVSKEELSDRLEEQYRINRQLRARAAQLVANRRRD